MNEVQRPPASAAREVTWQGLSALALETDQVRAVVVPEVGAKIVSLFDKRNGVEWLAGAGRRPLQPLAYGAPFVEQDMSGWDEMFPTISACDYPAPGEYHNAPLPDHGEVWAVPWSRLPGDESTITLAVEGRALPYRFRRTLVFSTPSTVRLEYEVVNLGSEPMPYIWAAHPQFACGEAARIVLPPHVQRVYNTLPPEWGWGPPETAYRWPDSVDPKGQQAHLDLVGPPALRRARKFFVPPDVSIGWVALVRQPTDDWLRMAWSPSHVPYFGLWVDEGALSQYSVATPEPTTGYYDSLAIAWEKSEVTSLEPGETASWALTMQPGTGSQPLF